MTYRIRRNAVPVADVDASKPAFTDTGLASGTQYTYTVTALDAAGNESAPSNALQVQTTPPSPVIASFYAYESSFSGGVRVAGGDVNGDGTADIVTAAGPGRTAQVKIFSGRDRTLLASFQPYDFDGGVFVDAGRVDGDGKADVVTGAGAGGGAHVKVFSGANLMVLASFIAFDGFTGGVRVAAGDVTGDGRADIVAGQGPGGDVVKVYDGVTFRQIASISAFSGFEGGVFVDVADVNGDRRADLIAGAGAGGGAHVKVFDAASLKPIASFFAFSDFRGGVRVAGGDVNGDGRADIIAGAGPGAAQNVKVFDGFIFRQTAAFSGFGDFEGGVFVGAGDLSSDGRADVIVGADSGGGPHVKVFDGSTLR